MSGCYHSTTSPQPWYVSTSWPIHNTSLEHGDIDAYCRFCTEQKAHTLDRLLASTITSSILSGQQAWPQTGTQLTLYAIDNVRQCTAWAAMAKHVTALPCTQTPGLHACMHRGRWLVHYHTLNVALRLQLLTCLTLCLAYMPAACIWLLQATGQTRKTPAWLYYLPAASIVTSSASRPRLTGTRGSPVGEPNEETPAWQNGHVGRKPGCMLASSRLQSTASSSKPHISCMLRILVDQVAGWPGWHSGGSASSVVGQAQSAVRTEASQTRHQPVYPHHTSDVRRAPLAASPLGRRWAAGTPRTLPAVRRCSRPLLGSLAT
jgi:hypothetical protein